ncbi:hypothetical protein BH09MYX1_BH09MYX1_09500 [soil metagenome]
MQKPPSLTFVMPAAQSGLGALDAAAATVSHALVVLVVVVPASSFFVQPVVAQIENAATVTIVAMHRIASSPFRLVRPDKATAMPTQKGANFSQFQRSARKVRRPMRPVMGVAPRTIGARAPCPLHRVREAARPIGDGTKLIAEASVPDIAAAINTLTSGTRKKRETAAWPPRSRRRIPARPSRRRCRMIVPPHFKRMPRSRCTGTARRVTFALVCPRRAIRMWCGRLLSRALHGSTSSTLTGVRTSPSSRSPSAPSA